MRPTCFPLVVRLALVLALPPAAALEAQEADEGASFLLLPVGAKAVALGRAMTALPGAESVFWNPAGLGELDAARVLLYRGDYPVVGESTAASGLFSRSGIGTVGLTYQLVDVGEQDRTDEQGNVVGTIAARNHLGVASVATRFWDRLNVGFNFKVVQFRLSCRGQCLDAGVTSTSYAVDGGVQLTSVAGLPLRIGAMVAHAGPRVQVRNEEQADPMPTRIRVAAAYEVLGRFVPSGQLSLDLTAETENRWRGREDLKPALYLGSEFSADVEEAALLVRAGYVVGNGEQVDGAGVGVAIRYNRFDLGIAKSLAANTADDTEPVHVTFGLIF